VGESAVFAAVASRDPGSLAGDVYWEVTGRGDFDGPLHRDPKKVAAELLRVLDPMVRRSPNRIAGIHLSWRVRDASDGYALVLQSIRRRIPAGWTLSAAVEGRLPEAARNRWKSAARKTDFLVADVFGRREDVDPAGFRLGASLDDLVDLGVPVYAGFAPQGRGVVVLPGRPPGRTTTPRPCGANPA